MDLDYSVKDKKRDKFDKTLDREVGDTLPNCVKSFMKLSFIELKMLKYHPLSGGTRQII